MFEFVLIKSNGKISYAPTILIKYRKNAQARVVDMVELPMLSEILVLMIVAVVAAIILSRFRLPVVAGLLAAGALAGPHGFSLVHESHSLEIFAEIGVVLLLFTIGLEFSSTRIASLNRATIFAGVLQVIVTTLIVTLVNLAIGFSLDKSLLFGMVVSLSSTAIVLRSLQERSEIEAPHGRLILATLIVQDLAIVPMILIVPILAGNSGVNLTSELLQMVLKAVVLLCLTWLLARRVIPVLMHYADATRSREVFLLSILIVALGIAWLSMISGLSLALGAFLAGIALANSDYAYRALSEVLPLRDVLTSLFFILMGMLFDVKVLFSNLFEVLSIFLVFIIGKSAITALGVMILKFPARVALLTGLGVAQFGEFGYLLLRAGKSGDLITDKETAVIMCAGVMSMFITPVLIRLAPHITAGDILLRPLEKLIGVQGISEPVESLKEIKDHIVIAGLGPAGRLVATSLRQLGIPYLILELNSETVRKMRTEGEPVYYADVTSREALHHANIENARAMVFLINDFDAMARSIAAIRPLNPNLPIFARCRFQSQEVHFKELGATGVVVEECEAAKEMVDKLINCINSGCPLRSSTESV